MKLPLDNRRLLGIVSMMSIVGGLFVVATVYLPHEYTRYDTQFLLAGIGFVVAGAAMRTPRLRNAPGHAPVFGACIAFSAGLLAMTWLSMHDLAGVHAVFLFLPLVIAASLAGIGWGLALLVLQSCGYAVVLATADVPEQLDAPTQWVAITLGLVVGLLYQRRVVAHLQETAALDEQLRSEREEHRAQHAAGLERVNEELRSANELKSRFVAMASHELRTPLTSIGGFAATMLHRWDAIDDDAKRAYVTIIDEQSERLGRLVADLLLLSRIEGGRLVAGTAPVDVAAVARQTINELGVEGVAVSCEPSVAIRSDEDHLKQVLVNLVSNALAYGARPVTVEAVHETDAWIVLRVRDHGPGVPPEFVPQLFTRFARGPQLARDVHVPGTGLGLSIVEGIAQAHGGEAWYEPVLPQGACFCVRLPSAEEASYPVTSSSTS